MQWLKTPQTLVSPLSPANQKSVQSLTQNLRSDLGVVGSFLVRRQESRAKREAAVSITRQSVEAATDVALSSIDQQRTILKTGLAAQAIQQYATITTECQARAAVTHERLSQIHNEGLTRIIDNRHLNEQAIRERIASGKLTESEADELIQFQHLLAQDDLTRMNTNMARAKDAVDALVQRATDHISTAE
ncbi:MAG: hypothetical protein HZB71_11280 [Betaproteobacteria bacterium]|nr:hypothetical protein [Betaproteobacteria bacterium]